MYPKIINVIAVDKYTLLVTFNNDIKRLYDCSNLFNLPDFYLLNDFIFFKSVKVDAGGYGVYWNDDIDISEYELWTNSIAYEKEPIKSE